MTLDRFVALLSTQPANVAGLVSQGQQLEVGKTANIAVFDPQDEWTPDQSSLQSKSANNPWIGKKLVGRVRHTICRGKLVVADRTLL